MDFSFLMHPDYLKFISENQDVDTMQLRLKKHKGLPFDIEFAIRQIESKRKARFKISELANQWIFPTDVAIEQATSEILARFHATLFKGMENVVDLTCGLGIDSFYIAQAATKVLSIDKNPMVAACAGYNFQNNAVSNIFVKCDDAAHFVKEEQISAPVAFFIDPSRRDSSDKNLRIYSIKDCSPDISSILPKISKIASFIIIKASPMVDLTQTLREYEGITDIWILSLKNECKELLFKIRFPQTKCCPVTIHTKNWMADSIQEFSFPFEGNHSIDVPVPEQNPLPGEYLYVPNSSVMKAGAFGLVCQRFKTNMVSKNSHLFVSDRVDISFPGRIFHIKEVFSLSKSDLQKIRSTLPEANIACRNFPLSPDELRKRIKIKDGGSTFLFGTSLKDKKNVLIVCEKVNA